MSESEMQREIVEFDENDVRKRRSEFMDLCLKFQYKIGEIRIHVNPISTLLGACAFWFVIGWALADSQTSIEKFEIARQWVTNKCTWFYISSQFVWTILIFVVYFKFGHIRLGLENDRPEYGNFDYFAMIFTTGICNGLFYDSANAPIVGYKNTTDNLLIYRGKSNRVTQAQNSLNVVMHHWGFHGFSVYILPCLLISVLCYRKGLPLTMRSCLYPVFGKKIFGRLGDIIDGVSIICMGFGVSTSFLVGAIMLVVGVHSIFPKVSANETSELIALWSVCGMSILSASSGIKLGIRRMSQLCFLTGALFTITVALSDDVFYLLNLSVQSIGVYFQYFISSSTFTGAILQKGNYPGSKKEEIEWMYKNTVFYWGWWLGWAPLVAIFATRISKGRTIKNIIEMAYILPSFVNFIWFVVVGGLAIDMENQALSKQMTCNMTIRPDNIPGWLQRLECAEEDYRFFLIMEKYEDIKTFLLIVALLITLLYFITSFDSAALVLGTISSNGEENPPFIQRVFWCLSIGACTSVMILYEKDVGRTEVNVFVILAGVPFAILMCFCGVALLRLLKLEPYWSYDRLMKWKMLYGNINSFRLLKLFFLVLICPSYWLGQISIKHWNREHQAQKRSKIITTCFFYTFPFYMWILLLLLRVKYEYVNNIGWALFIGFVVLAGRLRTKVRQCYEINGNSFEDVALMVMYPLTIVQMLEQVESSELEPRPPNIKFSNGWSNRIPIQPPSENGYTPEGGISNNAFRLSEPPMAEDIFHMGAIDDLNGGVRIDGGREAEFVEA